MHWYYKKRENNYYGRHGKNTLHIWQCETLWFTVHLETTDGLDLKTPKFPHHVIYSRYCLDKENIYMQFFSLFAILDELLYVCWSCISQVIITSYFPIKFLLSIFSSFFVQSFSPQTCMKNLAWIFKSFCCSSRGFCWYLQIFSLIFCFNIFKPQIPSPILLSSSKSNFTSSQLNSCCDNLSCIYLAPCEYLCIFFFEIAL